MKFYSILILVFLHLSTSPLISQTYKPEFIKVSRQSGFSGKTVYSIFQDSENYIWVATDAGLNRFDGYEFHVFKADESNPSSLSNSSAKVIFEDKHRILWIGTELGLNRYNRESESFTKYFSVPSDETTLSYSYITGLVDDANGDLIVATAGGGLCLYNREKDNFKRIQLKNKVNPGFIGFINALRVLPDNRIIVLSERRNLSVIDTRSWEVVYFRQLEMAENLLAGDIFVNDDNVYIGMNDHFIVFNIHDKTIRKVNIPSTYGKVNGMFSSAIIDNHGVIWFGTNSNGIFQFKKNSSEITANFLHNEYDNTSLSGFDISEMYIDNTNKIWVGTWGSGLNYYHPEIIKFQSFLNSSLTPGILPGNKVNVIFEDSRNLIWIGTESGLASYTMNDNLLRLKKNFKDANNSNPVLSICEDTFGNIWIGEYLGGLKKIDPKTGKVSRIPIAEHIISINDIWQDSPKTLLLATSGNGLYRYNMISGAVEENVISKLSSGFIQKIAADQNGFIWFGTPHGLNRFNRSDSSVTMYFTDSKNPVSISSNHVADIEVCNNGMILTASPNGLNIYNPDTDKFRRIGKKDGLLDDYIFSMKQDQNEKIWVSTMRGISGIEFNKETDSLLITNFLEYDGLQHADFRHGASFQSRSGIIFFGGNLGINYFIPERLNASNYTQLAIISKLLLYNEEVLPQQKLNGRVVLSKSLSETNEIKLRHHENVLTIEFSALNAIIPEKCIYRYKLAGFDKDWIITSSDSRRANYTNLDAGTYTFSVNVTNSNGSWSEVSDTLVIHILPPVWKTSWAYLLYSLFILGMLLLLRHIIITNERRKSQENLAMQEAMRIHEMDNLKIRFFTNISHEFRTPLTLIITPIEKLLKELKYPELEKPLQTIYINSKRLLNLVNQLLDFRKMEVSGLKLSPSTGDVVAFLKEMVGSFSDLAEKKQIHFKFRSNVNELIMHFDHDKLEKIIFNLLSNAFKYTLEHGEILVEVDLIEQINLVSLSEKGPGNDHKELQVKVKDTGIGIPADKLEQIFERFIQVGNSSKIVEHGSGIGLSLTREFVRLHGGEISVESEEGKGSCFQFTIPVNQDVVTDRKSLKQLVISETKPEELALSLEKKSRPNAPVVLLVEDSEDLRFYLRDNLSSTYTVLEAENGKIGLQKALELLPDLIISDIMMPEMDGVEMCRNIKNNKTTSHIPVILLTAKISEEQQIAGYEGGADAFLTKPFSFDILERRITNLIEQRKKLRQLFNQKIEVNPSEISVTSVDEKLIKKALEVVEANMSNSEFTVEQLGRELGMSRVHLYKKLLSLTGKSPIEFIRILRLKRAAQLLQKSQLRVSEIAYEVGFNNPKYFSKYFKEEFGMLPTEYASGFKG